MFVFSNKKVEKPLDYSITITFKDKEPLTIYFPLKENILQILKWYYDTDSDCLYLEYDINPSTQEANERMILERTKITKIMEGI